jgi:hypothetical protein
MTKDTFIRKKQGRGRERPAFKEIPNQARKTTLIQAI